jgi:hypothetical protein
MKSIRDGVPKPTSCGALRANRKLVQWVQQVGTGQIAIQIVRCDRGVHGVMQDFRWRFFVKGHQASAVVINRQVNYRDQRATESLRVDCYAQSDFG